ncbi:MAG: TonB-dependent receptor [Fidelibacterota bacterium]
MLKKVILLMIMICVHTLEADPQRGHIQGQVTDQKTAQPLAGVNVMVLDTEWGTMTDEEGYYRLKDIPAGSYVLRFSMIGYRDISKINVEVHAGNQTHLNVELVTEAVSLDAITVTAPAFEKSKGAVVSERTIDLGEIRTDPASQGDIQRSVQVLPSVSNTSDQMNEIIVRGGLLGENLFIIDDIEIPNPNHFGQPGTGGGPVNLINAEFVQSIDFYAGAFPAQFGDKASSVMNIKFREGSTNHPQFYIDMGMSGIGSALEGPIHEKGSYLLTFHKSFLDLVIQNTGLMAIPYYWNTQGKVVYRLSSKHRLIVNGVYGRDHIEIDADENDAWSRGAEYVYTENETYATGGTLLTTWNKNMYSKLTLYRNQLDYRYDVERYTSPGHRTDFANSKFAEGETALKLYVSKAFSPLTDIQFGGQIKDVHLDYQSESWPDTLFFYEGDSIRGIFRIYDYNTSLEDRHEQKGYGFVSMTVHPLERLKIIAGLRADYFTMGHTLTWAPRLGLSYRVGPRMYLNAGAGRHYQTPFYYHNITNEDENQPALNSKYSDHVIAGIEFYPADDMKFSTEIFYKGYSDLALPSTRLNPGKDTTDTDLYYFSEGKGKARGIEFFFHKKMFERWYAIASYSFSRSELWDPRYEEWYHSSYDFRHVANLVGGYKLIKEDSWSIPMKILTFNADEFIISVRYRYTGGRPYTKRTYYPELRRWYVDENHYNTERYPDYQRFDLSLQWKVHFKNAHLTSYLNIQNVFNRENIWEYSYGEDGSIEKILQYQTMPVGGFILEL